MFQGDVLPFQGAPGKERLDRADMVARKSRRQDYRVRQILGKPSIIGFGQNLDRRIEVRRGIEIYRRPFKPQRHLRMAPRLVGRCLPAGAHRQQGAGCDFVQSFGNGRVVDVDAANRLSALVLQRRERSPSMHDQSFFGPDDGTEHAPNRGGDRPVQQQRHGCGPRRRSDEEGIARFKQNQARHEEKSCLGLPVSREHHNDPASDTETAGYRSDGHGV